MDILPEYQFVYSIINTGWDWGDKERTVNGYSQAVPEYQYVYSIITTGWYWGDKDRTVRGYPVAVPEYQYVYIVQYYNYRMELGRQG